MGGCVGTRGTASTYASDVVSIGKNTSARLSQRLSKREQSTRTTSARLNHRLRQTRQWGSTLISRGISDKDLDTSLPSLILLGYGGVGKSTVAKQVAITLGEGIDVHNLRRGTETLIRSLVTMLMDVSYDEGFATKEVSDEVVDLFDEVQDKSGRVNWDNLEEDKRMFEEPILKLWGDDMIQEAALGLEPKNMEREMVYHNAFLCIKHLDHIFEMSFVLDTEDYIYIRDPTQKVQKTTGTLNGFPFQMVDCGGQIHLQQEWSSIIKMFHHNCAIIFIVSLPDYAKIHVDENALELSLKTWTQLWQNKALIGIPLLLLLNKEDIFTKEIQTVPLTTCPLFDSCPPRQEQETAEQFANRAKETIRAKFHERYILGLKERGPAETVNTTLYSHFTCSTDAVQVKTMVTEVVDQLNRTMDFATLSLKPTQGRKNEKGKSKTKALKDKVIPMASSTQTPDTAVAGK